MKTDKRSKRLFVIISLIEINCIFLYMKYNLNWAICFRKGSGLITSINLPWVFCLATQRIIFPGICAYILIELNFAFVSSYENTSICNEHLFPIILCVVMQNVWSCWMLECAEGWKLSCNLSTWEHHWACKYCGRVLLNGCALSECCLSMSFLAGPFCDTVLAFKGIVLRILTLYIHIYIFLFILYRTLKQLYMRISLLMGSRGRNHQIFKMVY